MASIRKRKFGSDKEAWIVDYRDQHGKRHLKTFPNKKAAEAWSVNALHEVQTGIHTPASVARRSRKPGGYGLPTARPITWNSEPSGNGGNIYSTMYCRSLVANVSRV